LPAFIIKGSGKAMPQSIRKRNFGECQECGV